MIEILVALTLLKMDIQPGIQTLDWTGNLQSVSAEQVAYQGNLEAPPHFDNAAVKFSQEPISRNLFRYTDEPVASANNANAGYHRATSESEPQYPKWRWFEQHKAWLSLDQRVLQTRGDHALFQHWSPF